MENALTWAVVDKIAAELGVEPPARAKWRQKGRGVPDKWKIRITQELMSRGVPVALNDFERLPDTPGRIAA